jgi:hypothetical protein
MARWADLVQFIRRNYEVVRLAPEEIRIRIHFGDQDVDDDGRAQIVIISRDLLDTTQPALADENGKSEWAQIVTPFAKVGQVDLEWVLSDLGDRTVVGGAAVMGEYLVLRHTVPLANLDLNEFVSPLELVAGSGEWLEKRFTGRDDY